MTTDKTGPCKARLPWDPEDCPNRADGVYQGVPICVECHDALTDGREFPEDPELAFEAYGPAPYGE